MTSSDKRPRRTGKPAAAPTARVESPLAELVAAEETIVDTIEPEPAADPAPVMADKAEAPPAAVPAVVHAKEETMDTTTTTSTIADKSQAMFADMKTRAEDTMGKGAKMFEEATAFNKGNIEAMVESGKIAAKGFETLGQEAADYARRSYETATTAFKTLSTVKSPTEFFKLQGDFARTAFDTMVAESSRSTERMIKLAGEVAQPLQNRFAVAAEKIKTAA